MHHPKGKQTVLFLCNIILIISMLCIPVIYSRTFTRQKNLMKRDVFCNTVESLKKVSENYLATEKGYADDWAAYIEAKHMTAEEALAYIRTTNTQEDRTAHLINMEDFSARSTYSGNGDSWVHYYEQQLEFDTEDSHDFIKKMQQIFDADDGRLLVLGKYRVDESQKTVISVGTRVMIRETDGSDRPYLLLRLIPVEYMQDAWVFPTEYTSAEVSLIVRQNGGYVVQSPSLRSHDFLEFIRAYNFPDDYNQINTLAGELRTNDRGLLEYKDSKNRLCYFYYSSIAEGMDIDILGYIPVDAIQTEAVDWTIVLLIVGMLLALALLDGAYILSINRRLRRAVREEEKANLAKTQFLSSMSHDIRTPMNAVIGMTEIAKHHLDDPAYVKACLDKVTLSGNHLLTLINDILDISKVESGKMTLNPAPFSLRDTVAQMQNIIRQSADEKGITFTTGLHDITDNFVIGDTLRIQQVLLNLLTNAVKYTESGGHVAFDVSEQPSEKENMVALRFIVSDDGMGMSEEFQQNMYSSFSRATDSRINKIQGSGLGLSIARQMVVLMNGTIECSSAPGSGTTFTVTIELPVTDPIQMPVPETHASDCTGEFNGMHILVAEDNDLNWEIIHTMLGEYGIRTTRALNGQHCLDLLHEKGASAYSLVLMDVQMPVMDGREATRRLRSDTDPALRALPVIAMTADAFAEDVYACLEAGMDAHIAKPLEMKRVLEILHRVQSGTLRNHTTNPDA